MTATIASAVALRSCDDIDLHAGMLADWHQSYRQLSRGAFDGAVTAIDLGGVRVYVERMNRTVFQRGFVPDRIALGIPLQLAGQARMCGHVSDLDGLHVFSGRDAFELLSPDCYLDCNVEFDPAALADPLASERLRLAAGAHLPARPGILTVDRALLDGLRARLVALTRLASAAPEALAAPAVQTHHARAITFDVAALLDDELCGPRPVRRRAARDWALVTAARELIETADACPASVSELAARLEVPSHALYRAFIDVTGARPVDYLRAIRLNRVRQSLYDAPSVTHAALRWGFVHFGRFAQDYRAMFGEPPSRTLQRVRRDSAHAAPQ
ncbi:helix-turn-helix domain-containing protein [Burkholderia stabilis]|uniref:helix-turn-helix domain-containing protein n=1 Tax=Burkholderia stabilis TaxID=95485 RepID=UPI001F4B2941|nr:helix-turn-helix domain-containing protein [Burkholderia stabilis]